MEARQRKRAATTMRSAGRERPGSRLVALVGTARVRTRIGPAQLLRARTVDLGIAEASVLEDAADLEIVAWLAPLDGYVVMRAGHPLAGPADVELADVLRYPFAQVVLLAPRALTPLFAAVRAASARGATAATPFPAIDCPTPSFAAKIVARSYAFTFATLGIVRAELERGQVVPVHQESWLRAEWKVVCLRSRTASPAMLAFVEDLRQAHADVLREETVLRT